MTEVATRDTSTELALSSQQTFWTEHQLAALRQMGVEKAGSGDLAVFHHVCQRTGLDPFARQIYMVGRNAKENGQWTTKYTIQTGIDGYRLVARRATDRLRETLEYEDTLWCGKDGQWTDVWVQAGPPAAAKVVALRHGKRFPAVATYAEYVQTTKEGHPNSMWSRMPANQLAKCAEALALRKAFPQDLSGVYTDDEMGQAERFERAGSEPTAPAADRMRGILGSKTGDSGDAATAVVVPSLASDAESDLPVRGDGPPESPLLNTRGALARRMFATLNEVGISDDERIDFCSATIGRTITSSKEMTDADAELVIAAASALRNADVTDVELPDPTTDETWGQG